MGGCWWCFLEAKLVCAVVVDCKIMLEGGIGFSISSSYDSENVVCVGHLRGENTGSEDCSSACDEFGELKYLERV